MKTQTRNDWRRTAWLAAGGVAGGLVTSFCVAAVIGGPGGLAGVTRADDLALEFVEDLLGARATRTMLRHAEVYWPTLLLTIIVIIVLLGRLPRRQSIKASNGVPFWGYWKVTFLLWAVQGAIGLVAIHRKMMMGWGWAPEGLLRRAQLHWHVLVVVFGASVVMAACYRISQGRWPSDFRHFVGIVVILLLCSLDWLYTGLLYWW